MPRDVNLFVWHIGHSLSFKFVSIKSCMVILFYFSDEGVLHIRLITILFYYQNTKKHINKQANTSDKDNVTTDLLIMDMRLFTLFYIRYTVRGIWVCRWFCAIPDWDSNSWSRRFPSGMYRYHLYSNKARAVWTCDHPLYVKSKPAAFGFARIKKAKSEGQPSFRLTST